MPAPAGYEEVQAPKGPPPGYDEVAPPSSGPATMSARRGGSTVTDIAKLHGSDIMLGEPGAAERKIGEGSTWQFLKDAARPVAIGAAVAAPIATAGASIPVQMAVGGLSGAAQSKLEGGSNKEAAISGGVGAALPLAIPAASSAIRRGIGYGKTLLTKFPTAPMGDLDFPGAHLPEAPPPEVLQAHGLAQGGRPVAEPSAALGKIPAPEVAPAPSRTPAWKSAEAEGIPVPSILNRQPYAQAAQLRAMPAPEAPAAVAPHSEYPPPTPARAVRLDPEPGSPEDIAETKDIQGQIKDAAEAEDRNRLLAVQRDRFPQRTKFDLTNQPVKFTKTPGVSRPDGVKPGTVVPAPDQDLTGLLKKSLKAAKKAKD